MAWKALLILLAVSAAVTARDLRRETRGTKDQTVVLGVNNAYDKLLLSQSVYRSSTILIVHDQKVDLKIPSGSISQIRIEDMLKTGKNAVVKVKSGGVGHSSVQLKFTSERGGVINYYVTIYGH